MTNAEALEHAKAKSDSLEDDLLLAFPDKIKVTLRKREFLLESPTALEVMRVRLKSKAQAREKGILLEGDPELMKLSEEEQAANNDKANDLVYRMIVAYIKLCCKDFRKYSFEQMKRICEQSGGIFGSPLVEAAAILSGQDFNAFSMQVLTEEDDFFSSPKATDGK